MLFFIQSGSLIFSVFGAAHPQGWRVSLIQALGWKKHASQTERAAKEEEQEVWTSHQIERKASGMLSNLSAGLPCKCACLSHLHTSACIRILTDCSFFCMCKVEIPEVNDDNSLGSQVQKNFICEHCYSAFRSSYHLKRHILTHTGTPRAFPLLHHLAFHIKRCIE